MTIGERLIQVREKLGYGQTEFAVYLGISQSKLSRQETNNIGPQIDYMQILNERFHVNINWIISGTGQMILDNSNVDVMAEPATKYKKEPKIDRNKGDTKDDLIKMQNDCIEMMKEKIEGMERRLKKLEMPTKKG
jgi:transcriptional regulator with XRE-family HTH domain